MRNLNIEQEQAQQMVFGHNPHFKAPQKKITRVWIILAIIVTLLILGYYVIVLSFGDKSNIKIIKSQLSNEQIIVMKTDEKLIDQDYYLQKEDQVNVNDLIAKQKENIQQGIKSDQSKDNLQRQQSKQLQEGNTKVQENTINEQKQQIQQSSQKRDDQTKNQLDQLIKQQNKNAQAKVLQKNEDQNIKMVTSNNIRVQSKQQIKTQNFQQFQKQIEDNIKIPKVIIDQKDLQDNEEIKLQEKAQNQEKTQIKQTNKQLLSQIEAILAQGLEIGQLNNLVNQLKLKQSIKDNQKSPQNIDNNQNQQKLQIKPQNFVDEKSGQVGALQKINKQQIEKPIETTLQKSQTETSISLTPSVQQKPDNNQIIQNKEVQNVIKETKQAIEKEIDNKQATIPKIEQINQIQTKIETKEEQKVAQDDTNQKQNNKQAVQQAANIQNIAEKADEELSNSKTLSIQSSPNSNIPTPNNQNNPKETVQNSQKEVKQIQNNPKQVAQTSNTPSNRKSKVQQTLGTPKIKEQTPSAPKDIQQSAENITPLPVEQKPSSPKVQEQKMPSIPTTEKVTEKITEAQSTSKESKQTKTTIPTPKQQSDTPKEIKQIPKVQNNQQNTVKISVSPKTIEKISSSEKETINIPNTPSTSSVAVKTEEKTISSEAQEITTNPLKVPTKINTSKTTVKILPKAVNQVPTTPNLTKQPQQKQNKPILKNTQKINAK